MSKVSKVFIATIVFLVTLFFERCTLTSQNSSNSVSISEEKVESNPTESEVESNPAESEVESNSAESEVESNLTESEVEGNPTESENEGTSVEDPNFFGVWRIDKVALKSKMYTGTTTDGDLEENLFDPADYLGYEMEYSSEFFRLGDKKYFEPEYVLGYTTVEEFQDGGIYQLPDLYEFILDEGITLDEINEYENMSDIPLQSFDVKFKIDVQYENYSFIPVGTQCTLLNNDTMLVGVWGKILLARKV